MWLRPTEGKTAARFFHAATAGFFAALTWRPATPRPPWISGKISADLPRGGKVCPCRRQTTSPALLCPDVEHRAFRKSSRTKVAAARIGFRASRKSAVLMEFLFFERL